MIGGVLSRISILIVDPVASDKIFMPLNVAFDGRPENSSSVEPVVKASNSISIRSKSVLGKEVNVPAA